MRHYERPPKGSAKDVVDYEIDMMEHCATRVLAGGQDAGNHDQFAFLEAFLLHFRILLEFFGKPNERYKDNVYFQLPLTCEISPAGETLQSVEKLAATLEAKWGRKLNKFLAHPTQLRYTTSRSWPVEEMRDQMRALVAHWKRHSPAQ